MANNKYEAALARIDEEQSSGSFFFPNRKNGHYPLFIIPLESRDGVADLFEYVDNPYTNPDTGVTKITKKAIVRVIRVQIDDDDNIISQGQPTIAVLPVSVIKAMLTAYGTKGGPKAGKTVVVVTVSGTGLETEYGVTATTISVDKPYLMQEALKDAVQEFADMQNKRAEKNGGGSNGNGMTELSVMCRVAFNNHPNKDAYVKQVVKLLPTEPERKAFLSNARIGSFYEFNGTFEQLLKVIDTYLNPNKSTANDFGTPPDESGDIPF
jgi:hypothetical protein